MQNDDVADQRPRCAAAFSASPSGRRSACAAARPARSAMPRATGSIVDFSVELRRRRREGGRPARYELVLHRQQRRFRPDDHRGPQHPSVQGRQSSLSAATSRRQQQSGGPATSRPPSRSTSIRPPARPRSCNMSRCSIRTTTIRTTPSISTTTCSTSRSPRPTATAIRHRDHRRRHQDRVRR